MRLLYVAIGGALGSAARYLVSTEINRGTSPPSPGGTFVVNVTGCLVFGLVAGLAERRYPLSASTRAFLFVGVLGGFTTFSSFAYDTFLLLEQGQMLRAAANAAGQVFVGLFALWAGYALLRVL
ncbi:MAG: fluoride efflux transporter CrcB [Acidobacteriota bacterium]